ncbi:hypothetical protein [Paenibacillus sp. FSL R5-0519]|uniref:hypothetical protein n=1 Tax=Paenibacillus sp. FSL R5-0519 TaxID=2921648 RepID=UPI0030D87412
MKTWLGAIIALGMIALLIGSIFEGNRIEQEQRCGTLTIVKSKMTNVELEPQKEVQTNISTLAYIIKVKLVDGQWKIDDLGVRSRAWNP